jgi:alpha-glucosidase
VTRWGVGHAGAPLLTALLTSLRGSSCFYQGEELGLPEAEIAYEDLQDPFGIRFWPEFKGRDGCRTPMPWKGKEANAAFTSADVKPWLPIPEQHKALAADQQQATDTVLQRIKTFLHWRHQQDDLIHGDSQFLDAPEPFLVMRRGQLCCIFNLSNAEQNFTLPADLNLTALSGHGFSGSLNNGSVSLKPYDACFAKLST